MVDVNDEVEVEVEIGVEVDGLKNTCCLSVSRCCVMHMRRVPLFLPPALGDLWIISPSPGFESSVVSFARSTFYGPNSDNFVDLVFEGRRHSGTGAACLQFDIYIYIYIYIHI